MAGTANSNAINTALSDNPSLTSDPSLAHTVITSANPVAAAPTMAHASNTSNFQQVVSDNAAQGDNTNFWQKVFGGGAKVVMGSLNWLNKPLQEVQRDYRYVHSVYTNYGIFNGLLATGVVAGGAALGTFLGPGGTALGAATAATLERKFLGQKIYDKSLADSENLNYKVSIGRDFSHLLGQLPGLGTLENTDTGLGKTVSGLTDVASVFALDPLVSLGAVRTGVRSGDIFLNGKNTKIKDFVTGWVSPQMKIGIDNFFERNSLRMVSADQVEKLYQAGTKTNLLDTAFGSAGKQYHRALNELADLANSKEGIGAIVSKYPGLQGLAEVIAPAAGKKITAKEVHDVFLQTKWDEDFAKMHATAGTDMVPSRTVLRAAVSKFSDKLRQSDGSDEIYLKANQANFFFPRKTNAATIVDTTNKTTGIITPTVVTAADRTWNTPVAFRAIKALNPFDTTARKELENGFKSAIAGKVRTFSGYVPYIVDDNLKAIATKEFNPGDSGAAQVVYRVARYSMGERMARQKTAEFVLGDIGDKKAIYSGMVTEMTKAAGIPNDPNFVAMLANQVKMHIDTPLELGNYGFGRTKGSFASQAETSTGTHLQGVIAAHAGKFAVPDFREVKLAMRQTGSYGKIYGKIDEWAAHYTDGIFKPLALLTGGFGLRIAASELIPQIFRFGGLDVAHAKIADSAAKMNVKLAKGEDSAILDNAMQALSAGTAKNASDWLKQEAAKATGQKVRKGISKVLNVLATEKDLELASRIAIVTKGHMSTGATLTGHGLDGDAQERLSKIIDLMQQSDKKLTAKFDGAAAILTKNGQRVRVAPTGIFENVASGDSKYDLHYLTNLHHAVNSESQSLHAKYLLQELNSGKGLEDAVKAVEQRDLANILKKKYDPSSPTGMGADLPQGFDLYRDERRVLAGFKTEDPVAFAHRRVDISSNLFVGPNGDINKELLDMVANGQKPSLDYLKSLDFKLKPRAVAGEKYEIVPGDNLLQKVINQGFKSVIDPIINNLSREPLFFNHVKNELASMDWAVAKGFFSEDEALRIAMTRATHAMLPQIHNVALRTQFGVLVRNYLPFYFAQEQAMRRAGTLVTTNPAAFRQYQLVQQGLNDPGFIETDSLGQKHINIPLVGELGAGVINGLGILGIPVVTGLPVTATGNLESLRTVLPELTMPGVSPFASIALNSLGALDPTLDRYIKGVVCGAGFNRSLIDQLIPNSPLRNAFHALSSNEQESSFYNAMIASIASAKYHGQMPSENSSPTEKAAFLDRIKNNARSILWIKALVSTWSPLSPSITQEDTGLRDEFYALLKQKSAVTGKDNTFAEALGIFLGKHGSNAISYTTGKTEAAVPGAMMPYTTEAINWIESHKALIDSVNGVGAAFLIPQTTSLSGDAQAIHDELIKMHLRSRKTPEEFMNSVYVSAGNNYIYSQKPIHDKAMADLAKAGLSQADERSSWSQFVKAYGMTNPIWEADYSSPVRTQNAQQAVAQLTNLFSSQNPPKGAQADLVGSLLNDYRIHTQSLTSFSDLYGQDAVSNEKDNWKKYLDTIVSNEPRLNSVVNSVFRRLA
jgi:hypothetical protein